MKKSEQLRVFKIWKSIQGEGPFSGMPAVFIRMVGCNLNCSFCDTDFSSLDEKMTVEEIVRRAKDVAEGIELVVVTGGEPFIQGGSPVLLNELSRCFRVVQVETNGTLWRESLSSKVVVVCSPKPGAEVDRRWTMVDAWKYVVQEGTVGEDGLPLFTTAPSNSAPVFLQPMDEGDPKSNRRNMELAVRLCLEKGYRLSLQLHKIIGVE